MGKTEISLLESWGGISKINVEIQWKEYICIVAGLEGGGGLDTGNITPFSQIHC